VRARAILGEVIVFLLVVGLSTALLASAAAVFEIDIKKIVALSTLSQLGLIFAALGLGHPEAAFFHLLTHAYFKALLFIAVGNSIHLRKDFQDLRQVGIVPLSLPVTLRLSWVANIRLCGVPFLAGFYSKDCIIELSIMGEHSGGAVLLLFASVFFTLLYAGRMVTLVCARPHQPTGPQAPTDNSNYIHTALAALFPLAAIGGSAVSWALPYHPFHAFLPAELKNLTLSVIFLALARLMAFSLRSKKRSTAS
jgi:NADH-ubiquinone oxidoreductase chain 5